MKKSFFIFTAIIVLMFCFLGCAEEEKDVNLTNVTTAMQELSKDTLKDSFYSVKGDTLKVMFVFDKEVLRNGPCNLIKEKLLDSLEGQYDKIDLNITQTKPSRNFINLEYRNGKWEQK